MNRFVISKTKIHQLIVSGGGANNPLLMAQLTALLAPTNAPALPFFSVGAIVPSSRPAKTKSHIEIFASDEFRIPTDAKEALAFAVLAYETIHQRPSNLPSATGASAPAILGKISYAPPR